MAKGKKADKRAGTKHTDEEGQVRGAPVARTETTDVECDPAGFKTRVKFNELDVSEKATEIYRHQRLAFKRHEATTASLASMIRCVVTWVSNSSRRCAFHMRPWGQLMSGCFKFVCPLSYVLSVVPHLSRESRPLARCNGIGHVGPWMASTKN